MFLCPFFLALGIFPSFRAVFDSSGFSTWHRLLRVSIPFVLYARADFGEIFLFRFSPHLVPEVSICDLRRRAVFSPETRTCSHFFFSAGLDVLERLIVFFFFS